MKIAHFYDGIYLKGGVRSYILSLTEQQIAAGDEVGYFELTPTRPDGDGIHPILVKGETELFSICREQSIDVLHYHRYVGLAPPAGLNVVYTVHEHTPHCLSGGLFLKRRQIPCPRTYHFLGCSYGHIRDHCGSLRPRKFIANLRRIHVQQAVTPGVKVVCVGQYLKNRMVKAGYPDRHIQVIPNFTDIDIPPTEITPSDMPQFLFIGRLENLKGVQWLLQAFKNTKLPSILNVCGEGTEAGKLKAQVQALHLGSRVKFLGWVDIETKIKLLKSARALIVPSLWPETFGLVAIEAAACARPVIVSNSGELPYIIENDHNGIVVDVGNVQQLSAAIDDLARDVAKASAMGNQNLLKYRSLYSPGVHKRQIDAVYAREV